MDFAQKHREAILKRKQREKKRRHQEILDAAKKVFLEKGFDRATMDEIAFEAAMSKPTIYQHFETKEDLFMSLLVSFAGGIEKGLRNVYEKTKARKYSSGVDVIRDVRESIFDIFLEDPEMFKLFMIAQQTRVARLAKEKPGSEYRNVKSNLLLAAQISDECIRQGFSKEVNSFHVAYLMSGAFVGILQMAILRAERGEVDKNSRDFKEDVRSTLAFAENMAIESFILK